ncbi:MAG: virulence RhuM family protein [Flavobacteriia bacterium]
MKNEIILYRPNEVAEHIEVRLENDTVWLNRQQIATLFGRDVKTIGKHITNALNEELEGIPTVANFAIVHFEGKRKVKRNIEFYNLDVVLSVGYRVKSKQGIHFRIWANRVLTNHLLEGFTINNRINQLELKLNKDIGQLTQRVDEIEIFISTNELPTQGVFFDGQLFDAYELISKIIRSATKEIILIDNYIDESVLIHLSKRAANVEAILYTQKISAQLQLDLAKHNAQYPGIQIKTLKTAHDRFLILDRKELYHIGASLKDLGKKCLPAV